MRRLDFLQESGMQAFDIVVGHKPTDSLSWAIRPIQNDWTYE
jgi:hypothetical protein